MPTRLPIPAPPATGETIASWMARLAVLHGVPAPMLWEQGSTPRRHSRRRDPDPAALAALIGWDPDTLRLALPELTGPGGEWATLRHRPQPGCPRCLAHHLLGDQIQVLLPHTRYVCTRHRYWIGPPDAGQPATPLTPAGTAGEQIVRAQHQHDRLARRHGPAAAFDAVLTGFLICGHAWDHTKPAETGAPRWPWEPRADALIPPGTELRTYSVSRLFAATYPEAVQLAGLIADPTLRARAHGTTTDQEQLLRRACAIIGNPRPGHSAVDAIRHWMSIDTHHPPSAPTKLFPDTTRYRSLRLAEPGRATRIRQGRAAPWFALTRSGGGNMLHHQHIHPVLIREWSRPMDGIEATIWATTATPRTEPPDGSIPEQPGATRQ